MKHITINAWFELPNCATVWCQIIGNYYRSADFVNGSTIRNWSRLPDYADGFKMGFVATKEQWSIIELPMEYEHVNEQYGMFA